MQTAARTRGVAAESDGTTRGRAPGDSASGRRLAAAKVPNAYPRTTARSVSARTHRASAPRAIVSTHAFLIASRQNIRNRANSLTTNEKTFSNR